MIQAMHFALTIVAVWATCIAPQLCRIGVLTACCADVLHRQPASERDEAWARGCCDHECQQPEGGSGTPDNRDCGTCENFCGAVVKPADAGGATSQLHGQSLACLPATSCRNNGPVEGLTEHALQALADLPCRPRPPSDFPLLI
jgi:hypothetical protein